jgi:hypothetical protein
LLLASNNYSSYYTNKNLHIFSVIPTDEDMILVSAQQVPHPEPNADEVGEARASAGSRRPGEESLDRRTAGFEGRPALTASPASL